MASMKLLVCVLAVAAVVESIPLAKRCCNKKRECQDEYINKWFSKISITVNCDFEWIQSQIKLIECKRDVAEYVRIMELWEEFQTIRSGFDNCYGSIQEEIFGLVGGYREKFSALSICYTERIVSCRKKARRHLFPDICKYRSKYIELIALIEEFCGKYTIDIQPRAIAMPRDFDYSFIEYYPKSCRSNDLVVLIDTCFKDYRFIYDLIYKLPDCGPRTQLIEEITNIWIDFDRHRRRCDIDCYPRFLPCWEDQEQVDLIYIDYINKLRPYQIKFASCYFDIISRYEDLCRERSIEIIDFIDYDNFNADCEIPGLYFPSNLLREYFSGLYVTPRLDYVSVIRQWNELNFPCGCPEWKRREEIICELKRLLREYERIINRLIRDCYRRCIPYFDKCNNWDKFDVDYRSFIDEIIVNCNNELYPYLLEFRAQYYVNDECLLPILQERGILDLSRTIIPCNNNYYDISRYICDNELIEIIRWIENCFRTNYYGPVGDLVQLNFNEECEERNLKRKCLKDLECIWFDYHKIIHQLLRRWIELICRKKCVIGSEEYNREIIIIREWCTPLFTEIVGRFKSGCGEIDGILERLYKKNCGCKKRYRFIEASFEMSVSIKSSRSC